MSGDEETPIELRIICSVSPGDGVNRPHCRITNVAVSPADEDVEDRDEKNDDELDDLLTRIEKLRRKENGEPEPRVAKKHEKKKKKDDSDDESDDQDRDDEDEDEENENDDDEESEILECITKSTMKKR